MAVVVVDVFEVVDIEHDGGQRAAETASALKLVLPKLEDSAPIVQAGQVVGDSQQPHLLVQPRFGNGCSGQIGEGHQHTPRPIVDGQAVEGDDADDFVVGLQGDINLLRNHGVGIL